MKWCALLGTLALMSGMEVLGGPYDRPDLSEIFRASREDEDYWLGYVASNAALDYATLIVTSRIDSTGGLIVDFAAVRNYRRLLEALEAKGAVSRYRVQDGQTKEGLNYYDTTPLDYALMNNATQSVEYLARIRPDWLHRDVPTGVGPPVMVSLVRMNYSMVEKLLDLGADVNSGKRVGFTLMDQAAQSDINVYETIRRRGGKFCIEFTRIGLIRADIREALVAKYINTACHVFTNRIEFPSGAVVEYPSLRTVPHADTNMYLLFPPRKVLDPITPESRARMTEELRALGAACSGTVIFECHAGWRDPKKSFIDPVLDELNLVGIFIGAAGLPEKEAPTDRSDFYPRIRDEDGIRSANH